MKKIDQNEYQSEHLKHLNVDLLFSKERLSLAIAGERIKMPEGLSREEKRKFMLMERK